MYRVATFVLTILDSDILAIFYPISEIGSGLCVGLSLQAREGHIYFTELAERVEYGNYDRSEGTSGRRPGEGRGARTLGGRSGAVSYVYIYIYIYKEREREKGIYIERER